MGIKWRESASDTQTSAAETKQNVGKNWNVTFSTDSEAVIEAQTVKDKGKVKEPEAPKKEGHTFGGWFKDDKLTESYDFKTPVTSDITLYAKWTTDAGSGAKGGTNGGNAGGDK